MIKIDTLFMTKMAKQIMPFGSRDGAALRALTSHLCGPGSNPEPGVTCRLSLLLVLVPAPRVWVFFLVFRFSSNHKNQHCKFQFDSQMRATVLSALLLVSPSLNNVIHLGPHLPISSISGTNPSPGLVVFLMISDNHGGCHGNTVTYELMVRVVFN